jgi:hypothetical protein
MRVTLTEREVCTLAHIMNHFTDYMGHDDRPDHGLGILKQYRNFSDVGKREIYVLAGRLLRLRRKIQRKQFQDNYGRKEI